MNLTGFSCVMAETKSWTTFNFFRRRKPSVDFFYLFSILFRLRPMKRTLDKLSQSKRKPKQHYKMPRLDLKSEVKM